MKSTTSVLHIGTSDNYGGAARASFRIHRGLKQLGVVSRLLVGHSIEHSVDVAVHPPAKKILDRVFRYGVNRAEQWTGLENVILPWRTGFHRHPFVRQANIFHLHNLHGGFFPLDILPHLDKWIVWSPHDMWPLTGHCYYPDMANCTRWKTGCGQCPDLKQENHYPLSIDTTAYLWKRKKRIYDKTRMILVAQTSWMEEQFKQSILKGKPIVRIPCGIDTEIFRPIEQKTARDILHIPREAKVVFFSAMGLDNPRKGWVYLREALKTVSATLLTAGYGDIKEPGTHLGWVTDDRVMNLAYNAADVFVCPSLVDNVGTVFLEAAACGIPSVGFNTSGVQDSVKHNETGLLAEAGNVQQLSQNLCHLLSDGSLRKALGRNALKMATENSMSVQAQRYADLYRRLLTVSPS